MEQPTPGTFMTVSAPSQSGEVLPHAYNNNNNMNSSSSASMDVINGLANQEVHIAKIQNNLAALEEAHLTHDPRYASLQEIRDRLQARIPVAPGTAPSGSENPSSTLNAEQRTKFVEQLRAQVAAYRIVRRGENIPQHLLSEATAPVPIKLKVDGLPPPYQIPLDLGDRVLPYNLEKLHQYNLLKYSKRSAALPAPKSIDPNVIAKEREQRISTRIMAHMKSLSNLPADLPEHLRVKAQIQLRGLRLINLQAAVRHEVLHALKVGSTVEHGLNSHAYRRVKKHTLREARVTEKLEKQQKQEQERRRRLRHVDFLQSTIQASKDFANYHKNNRAITAKVRKTVINYHANTEKERKKEEEKNEKLRLMKLMQEDEEGYRQLLDEKKDKRLVYLLEQTDEYVKSLTGLVRQHQQTEKKKKKDEREAARKAIENDDEIHVIIRNCVTGEILTSEETPKQEDLEAWLEIHPGYEIVSRNIASDSDDDDDRVEVPKAAPVERDDDEFDGLDEEQRSKRIIERARNEEDEYDQRTRMQMESYYATAHRIKEKVVKQHSSLGAIDHNLQLKPYQIKGLEWMVSLYNNNLNGILADEMGLGKTIQTVALITYLMEVKKVNGPFLIIVPLSTISNWVLEFDKWSPHVCKIVYKGERESRKKMDILVKKGAFNVLLTTYEYVIKEKNLLGKIKWKYMIIDEGHRMKNHTCKLTLTLNAYFSVQHRLLLTGTPLQNKLPELWALLNFLLPSIFSSCGTFEQWFNAPFATTGEKVELNQEETVLIIRRLHKVLRPFLLRRLKKEVESQLPEKTEQIIKCNLTCLQRLLYEHMKNGLLLDSSSKRGRALQNTIMHLRKLCNHPFLFESVERDCKEFWGHEANGVDLCRVAGKFDLLDRILHKLQATGHRVLLFCQMTHTMTILEDYFNYRGWLYLRLDGSTKHDERGELLKTFNAPDSKFNLFMLSTRAGGLGLNLQTADTVIIFDSDWNPHQDMQAQDRAHRIGQKREVRVLRLITVNSVEEKILAAARYKLNIDEKVIQAGKFDQRSTDAERRQILEAIISREDDNDEDEVPDDETINNMIARGDDEFEIFQNMDIERTKEEKARGFERLIQENEIPVNLIERARVYTENAAREAENAGDKSFVDDSEMSNGGRRARKKVDYANDLMTDRDWLKTLDEDPSDDEEPPVISKKPEPPKRGRKKKAKDNDASDDERRGAPPAKKKPRDDSLQTQLSNLLEALIDYKDSNGRPVSTDFIQLPSKRELPEYYESINQPIDFNRIRKNLRKNHYDTIDALGSDIRLLCRNAQTFNMEDSDIYRDSTVLLAVWDKIKSQAAAAITAAAAIAAAASNKAQAIAATSPLAATTTAVTETSISDEKPGLSGTTTSVSEKDDSIKEEDVQMKEEEVVVAAVEKPKEEEKEKEKE